MNYHLQWAQIWWTRVRINSQLSSISAFLTDLKIIQTPHTHTVYSGISEQIKPSWVMTRWSGGSRPRQSSSLSQVPVPSCHLAITPEGYSRRRSKILTTKSMAELLEQRFGTAWTGEHKINKIFGLLLEQFCSFFKHFAQLGSCLPRRQFVLPFFKFRPGKGVFWDGFGDVLCTYTSPKKSVWRLGNEEGFIVVFWANWDLIWAQWDPSGQFVRKMGNIALVLEEKIQSSWAHTQCVLKSAAVAVSSGLLAWVNHATTLAIMTRFDCSSVNKVLILCKFRAMTNHFLFSCVMNFSMELARSYCRPKHRPLIIHESLSKHMTQEQNSMFWIESCAKQQI